MFVETPRLLLRKARVLNLADHLGHKHNGVGVGYIVNYLVVPANDVQNRLFVGSVTHRVLRIAAAGNEEAKHKNRHKGNQKSLHINQPFALFFYILSYKADKFKVFL